MEISRLIEIAQNLGFEDLENDLQWLSERKTQPNCPLVLPLVGEFNAGKTTLINALTDNKGLETHFDPTTSTLFEIHFGCDSCYAIVFDNNGESKRVDDIGSLKNSELNDAVVVEVFDTSKQVPSSTILVDTPGISSPDPKHKQTLLNILPKADGVLLVIDINQGMVASTVNHEFVKNIARSKRPIYVVLSHCSEKSLSDIQAQKDYLIQNAPIPIKEIVCISSKEGDLQELYQLFEKIQKDKDKIKCEVDQQRLKNIAQVIKKRVDELLNSIHSDKDLEDAIRNKKSELDKLKRNIDRLVMSLEDEIVHGEEETISKFKNIVYNKLYSIAGDISTAADYNTAAASAIDNTMCLMLNEYKDLVKEALYNAARSRRGGEEAVPLRSLEDIDVSSLTIQGPDRYPELNGLGHEYDKYIADATRLAIILGLAYAGGAFAGGAATTTTAGSAGKAVAGKAASSAASQAGGKVATTAATTAVKKASWNNLGSATDIIVAGGQLFGGGNGQTISANGSKKTPDLIDLGTKLLTDEFRGKPQRRKAILDYLESCLIPTFKSEIKDLSRYLTKSIKEALDAEAAETINTIVNALEQLRSKLKEQKTAFQLRKKELLEYKNELQN